MDFVQQLMQANPGTISLGQGVVHYSPPEATVESMTSDLHDPVHHLYGHVFGRTSLIELFREKLVRENQLQLTGNNAVIVTAGSNMAFAHTILAITDPGDEIILLAPYYFNHEMAIRIASCHPVVVHTTSSFEPDIEAIRQAISTRTRAIVTISPNNPTGVVYAEHTLRTINALCQEHSIYHISDEAYEYFTFDGATHFSPGAIQGADQHTITLNSMSKAYGMAGWRIGYMTVPVPLLSALKKIQDTTLVCPPMPCQIVAAGAMQQGKAYCRQYLGPMAEVRTLVLNSLATLASRVRLSPSRGAFYVFLDIDTRLDPVTLTRRLIEEYRVAVIPGTTFGLNDRTCLRVAYGALQHKTVAEAIGRLVKGLTAILEN